MPQDTIAQDDEILTITGADAEEADEMDATEEVPDSQEAEDVSVQGSEGSDESESSADDDAGHETGERTDHKPVKPEGEWIPKARFDEVWGRMREAEAKSERAVAEAKALKRENDALRADLTAAEAKAGDPSNPDADLKEPTRDQFGWDEEGEAKYNDAVIDYKAELRLRQRERERESQSKAQAAREADMSFMSKIKAYSADHPEYVEAIKRYGDLPYKPDLYRRIAGSDNSAEIDAYFYANLPEFERVNAMSRDDQIEALAYIKRDLKAKQTKPTSQTTDGRNIQRKQSTSAPPPIGSGIRTRPEPQTFKEDGIEEFTIR